MLAGRPAAGGAEGEAAGRGAGEVPAAGREAGAWLRVNGLKQQASVRSSTREGKQRDNGCTHDNALGESVGPCGVVIRSIEEADRDLAAQALHHLGHAELAPSVRQVDVVARLQVQPKSAKLVRAGVGVGGEARGSSSRRVRLANSTGRWRLRVAWAWS